LILLYLAQLKTHKIKSSSKEILLLDFQKNTLSNLYDLMAYFLHRSKMMTHSKVDNSILTSKSLQFPTPSFNKSSGQANALQSNFNLQIRPIEKKFRTEIFNFFIEHFYLKEAVQLKEFLENLERNILIKTLTKFNGNQKNAAKFLGLKHTTLHEKVKKYNIHFRKEPIIPVS